MDGFDEIRRSLTLIYDEDKDISLMLDAVNDIFRETKETMIRNKKAALLAMYYDVQFRDGELGLSKKEYRRLLGRMSKSDAAFFEELGDFESLAGDDGIIDLVEFQELIERLINATQHEMTIDP